VTAVALALAAHAVAICLLVVWADLERAELHEHMQMAMAAKAAADKAAAEEQPMQIETLVDDLQRPDEQTEEEKQREEEKKKEEESKKAPGQVVDLAKPLFEEHPDIANYVSEYDTKVDKESKKWGREHGGAAAGATAPPTPLLPEGTRPDARPTREASKGGKPGPLAMRELERKSTMHGAQEAPPPPDRDGEQPQQGERGAPTPLKRRGATGEAGDGRPRNNGSEGTPGMPGVPMKPNLQPTKDMLQTAIGRGAGSMDYLKDVDDGESTALNAKKWKHAPFFNRVKRQVADEWHPEMVYVRHDPNGNVYGVKDRVTMLRVHLTPDGKLAGWTILQSSGVDFLDDEAIDAFKKAAPFPNPPKDLVEADGQIHFNFGFIFELSGHGSLKVYKYN
jgi:TonB family protein